MPDGTCVICGATLTGRQTVTCSRACSNKRYQQSPAGRAVVKRSRERWAASNSTNVCKTKRCERCGSPGVRYDARYCSRECHARARAGWSTSTDVVRFAAPATDRPRGNQGQPTSGRIWVAGSCVRCNAPFVIVDQVAASYCSTRCAAAHAKARRRALKRNAYVADVSPSRIYQRDGYRCQLCGRKVDRTVEAPHPMAPTIDHILPLAVGGRHEPSNAQCAHFICNSRKGDRPANDQLRLIG